MPISSSSWLPVNINGAVGHDIGWYSNVELHRASNHFYPLNTPTPSPLSEPYSPEDTSTALVPHLNIDEAKSPVVQKQLVSVLPSPVAKRKKLPAPKGGNARKGVSAKSKKEAVSPSRVEKLSRRLSRTTSPVDTPSKRRHGGSIPKQFLANLPKTEDQWTAKRATLGVSTAQGIHAMFGVIRSMTVQMSGLQLVSVTFDENGMDALRDDVGQPLSPEARRKISEFVSLLGVAVGYVALSMGSEQDSVNAAMDSFFGRKISSSTWNSYRRSAVFAANLSNTIYERIGHRAFELFLHGGASMSMYETCCRNRQAAIEQFSTCSGDVARQDEVQSMAPFSIQFCLMLITSWGTKVLEFLPSTSFSEDQYRRFHSWVLNGVSPALGAAAPERSHNDSNSQLNDHESVQEEVSTDIATSTVTASEETKVADSVSSRPGSPRQHSSETLANASAKGSLPVGVTHQPRESFIPIKRQRIDIRYDGPIHDKCCDEFFRTQVIAQLLARNSSVDTWGGRTNSLIIKLLERARPPSTNQDMDDCEPEAFFFDSPEAAAAAESAVPTRPIITSGEQAFRWPGSGRPIEQLFSRMEVLGREVSVQVPSRSISDTSYEVKTLIRVQERFAAGALPDDPWNLLDLQSPLPRLVMPNFLAGENCQLLARMRESALMPQNGQRLEAKKVDWRTWKDVEEWILLSEAGHNTAPHMDSNGFSTWLSVQEGQFGVGWLAARSQAERDAWVANPWSPEGNWRFIVLRPGQTVFFGSGTIHFVFRLRSQQTLAVGGHVLQWNGIPAWLDVLELQLENPEVTNEEMKDARKFVETMSHLVKSRLEQGTLRQIGSKEQAEAILARAKKFFQKRKKGR